METGVLPADRISAGVNIIQPTIPQVQTADPVAAANRIKTLDVIRGFALLGILLMNIPFFGLDQQFFFELLRLPPTNADYIANRIILTFFDGTMRGLFSMLFGAGMLLFTITKKESSTGSPVVELYYRRLLWLVLFGLINAFVLLWPGDILFYYGLCGMLLYPFRKLAPRTLIILGMVCMLASMIKPVLGYSRLRETRAGYLEAVAAKKANKKLSAEQEKATVTWGEREKSILPDSERLQNNVRKMRSGYTTVFTHLVPENANFEVYGMYFGFWDMLSMMFIGMGLFGLGFFSNKLKTSTYVMVLLVGYGVGIPVGMSFFQGFVEKLNLGHFVDMYRLPPDALYDFRRLLLASGHASLIILVFRSGIVSWLMKALANVGQMAFTNYLMQSIICSLVFYGYGLGYYNKLRFHQLYYIVGAIWIFQIIFSVIWLRYFRFGPFEWLWRSLSYWKKQPMLLQKN